MDADMAISILKQTLGVGVAVIAPILATGLVVGLSVGAVQAATQINEPTLTFVPKVVVVGLVGALLLPWGLDRFIGMFRLVIMQIEFVAGGG